LSDDSGRDLGIAGWENMGMGKFHMGLGMAWEMRMTSLKWEGIGTTNLFPAHLY